RDFDELAAVEDEICGVAVALGMIEVGGNGGRYFGAFAVLDGVEEAAAGRTVGILVADFHFAARFEVEAEEALDGFADEVATNFQGSNGGGGLLRERFERARCCERADRRND